MKKHGDVSRCGWALANSWNSTETEISDPSAGTRLGDGAAEMGLSDLLNILYANLVLPATLFAAVQTADASLTLTLPEGYECVRTADINGESPWRAEELGEDTLGVFQDEIPQGTGSLDEGSGTRGWSVNGNVCLFTLRQNAVVYAGSSLYIRVTANNPTTALKRTDAANRWQVTLTSKGYHQYYVTFPPVIFNTIMQNFSSNTAVLGKIMDPLILPSNPMYSVGGLVMSQGFLNIFFRSEQGTGVQASVHVEAPMGFSFSPNPCQVVDLEDSYYATPGQMGSATRRLPGLVSCEHRTYPYNHAAIKLTGAILSNSFYAFGLWVSNAEVYESSQRTGWRIFTVDMNDYRVDGTDMPIPMAAHTARNLPMSLDSTQLSFGLYRAQLNTPTTLNVQVSLMNAMPYSMSMQRTTVTILPLRVVEEISSTLRVSWYDWDFQDSEFRHLALFPNATQSLVLLGTNANLPGGKLNPGQIIEKWGGYSIAMRDYQPESVYLPNETYGFQTFVRVPDRGPTSSPNAFIFEFGHVCDAQGAAMRAVGVDGCWLVTGARYIDQLRQHLPSLVSSAAAQRPRVARCDEERRGRRGAERQRGGAVERGRAADADQGRGWVNGGYSILMVLNGG
eukprot:s1732_g2.t3